MRRVTVETHARLHLGFLDLNGELGRRFGSIGLAIDAFPTLISLTEAAATEVVGAETERARRSFAKLREALSLTRPSRLEVVSAAPSHAGLGSGTQLALAIGAAAREFSGLPRNVAADAQLLDRGARSGVGLALFDRGGLVVDSGRGADTALPPIVAALPFPEDWRVLLLLDRKAIGVHGEAEARAFAALPRLSAPLAGEICRRVLMQILPGAAESDLDAFGDGLARIQVILGDHFASAQGGARFTSAAVGRAAARLGALGARGIGQSSWGPTGFAFAADRDEAEFLARRAREEASDEVEIRVCGARSRGAEIHAE